MVRIKEFWQGVSKKGNATDIKSHLAELRKDRERDTPLVFVGRTTVIDEIVSTAKTNGPTEIRRGASFLVEGAPGSGKTSLVHEIANRLQQDGALAIVWLEVPDSPEEIDAIYNKMATGLAGASQEFVRTTEHTSRGFSFRPSGVGGGTSSGTTVAPQRISSPQAIADIRGGKPWAPYERAVVFVDEIQNVEPDGPASRFLRQMHTQQSIPVILVCSGLSNSEVRLAKAGLSRISTGSTMRLGALSPSETLECARASFTLVRDLGLDATDEALDLWAESVARASDGWPRHLQNYLRACWLTLSEQDKPSLDTADMDTAIRCGDGFRDAYYMSRLKISQTPIDVIGPLHERIASGDTLDRMSAQKTIGVAVKTLDKDDRKEFRVLFPSNSNCFDQLLSSGIVSMNEKDTCISPVPSLSAFLLDLYSARVGKDSKPLGASGAKSTPRRRSGSPRP